MNPTPSSPNDNLFVGCLLGCAVQCGFFLVGLLAATAVKGNKLSGLLFLSWGVTQWIALGPLIWQQRAKGYPKRIVGMIITGCLGLLLSSACGSMLLR